MKKLSEYVDEVNKSKAKKKLKESSKPQRVMAPQDTAKEELWNSTKDRWSRRAKHPLKVNEILSETALDEISTPVLKSYSDKAKQNLPKDRGMTGKEFKRSQNIYKVDDVIRDRENPVTSTVHDYQNLDDREVYDITQTNDDIKDGDILSLSDGRKAILVKAWPVMVVGSSDVMHTLSDGITWDSFKKGRYAQAAKLAQLETGPDSLAESVMGGMQPLNPIGRMMQLAGIASHAIIEPIAEDEEKKICKKCGSKFTPSYGEYSRCPECLGKEHAAAEHATGVQESKLDEALDQNNAFDKMVMNHLQQGEFKGNEVSARLAALGEILIGTKDIVDDLKTQSSGSMKPDVMTKLEALDAFGALLINEARALNNKKAQ